MELVLTKLFAASPKPKPMSVGLKERSMVPGCVNACCPERKHATKPAIMIALFIGLDTKVGMQSHIFVFIFLPSVIIVLTLHFLINSKAIYLHQNRRRKKCDEMQNFVDEIQIFQNPDNCQSNPSLIRTYN